MPAAGHVNPKMLNGQIEAWLTANPGEHRTKAVADGIDPPPGMSRGEWVQKVGNACARLARQERVNRTNRDIGQKRPVGHYSAKD